MPRYRFSDFVLSPRRRMLVRQGREQPLIPRYFDLLVFLIERRHEAVHRRDIFDRVWNDVVVSDSALSQAIRTIRRTLGDDSREPRFIRTVSRHGYRFVFADVVEEQDGRPDEDDRASPAGPPGACPEPIASTPNLAGDLSSSLAGEPSSNVAGEPSSSLAGEPSSDPFEPLLQLVTREAPDASEEEAQREAAELLHALGTSEALRRLGTRPRHAFARALLRDTRWETAQAGAVPFIGAPAPIAAAGALVALRLRRAARIAAARWAGASFGGGLAGAAGGATGGLVLAAAPGSSAPIGVAAVLAAIGSACGAAGGAGVGAGLSMAEAIARSQRTTALIFGGALGGGLVGSGVQWLARWGLAALVGVHVEIGGALEGLVIGGAAGLGYAAATSRVAGGIAAPRGHRRVRVAAVAAEACALAGLALTLAGRPLVGGTLHTIAQAANGSQVSMTPLGRIVGEPDFGPISRAVIGMGEGGLFGFGLALGLTRRPSSTSHAMLTER